MIHSNPPWPFRSGLVSPILLSLAGLLATVSPSNAVNRYWIAGDGNFSSTSNWAASSGGAGGASIPGPSDIAKFDRSATYDVRFSSNPTNSALDVARGTVTFDLNTNIYTLTSSSAVDVGVEAGQTARLTLIDGQLRVNTTGDNVSVGVVSTGFLTLNANSRVGSGLSRPDLFIGTSSNGTVTLNDNSRIDAQLIRLGGSESASGTLTLNDPASIAVGHAENTIGNFGQGTLRIFNGATYHAAGGSFLVGASDTASGSVTVSGSGSLLDIDTAASIGSSGVGSISVSSGGRVTNAGIVRLGVMDGASGSVSLNGPASRWDIGQALSVGEHGMGAISLANGAKVEHTGDVDLALNSDSEGRLTIDGLGSRWVSTGELAVGFSGSAELTVEDGGELHAGDVRLGVGTGSGGTAILTGPRSALLSNTGLQIAGLGSGSLTVSDGAEVSVGTNLSVNDPAGFPNGILTLDGGSIFVGGDFTRSGVFNFTDGHLRVGGVFEPNPSSNPLFIDGQTQGDLPTLELVGTNAVQNVSSIVVGDHHRGQLILDESRTLDGLEAISLGREPGAEGILLIESGASVTNLSTLAVGGTFSSATPGGSGQVTIRSGGSVQTNTLRLFAGGSITLDGGSFSVQSTPQFDGQFHWINGDFLYDASTTLDDEAVAALTGSLGILASGQTLGTVGGQSISFDAPLTVAGGSVTPHIAFNLSTIQVLDGGIQATFGAINDGTILLDGPLARFGGASLTENGGTIRGSGILSGPVQNMTTGRIEVGSGKDLLLTGSLDNEGAVDVLGGNFRVRGAADNVAGTGVISGRNALLSFDSGLANDGSLIAAGGVIDILGDITNNAAGRIVVSGGATAIFYEDVVNSGAINVSAGGPLSSTAVFFGDLSGNGVAGAGTVFIEGDARPGFSPGLMTYGGDVSFGPFSSFHVELGGTTPGTEYDKLEVANHLSLDGSLEVTLINGFLPSAGDRFDVWDAASKSGNFSSVTLPDLPAGLFWHTSALETEGILAVSGTPQSYAEYAAYYGLTTSPDGSQDFDPFSNLVQYALGLNPRTNDSNTAGIPTLSSSALADVFSFDMPTLSSPDLELQIQSGTDLVGWEVLATRTSGGTWTGPFPPILTPRGGGRETVTVERSLSGDTRRFFPDLREASPLTNQPNATFIVHDGSAPREHGPARVRSIRQPPVSA